MSSNQMFPGSVNILKIVDQPVNNAVVLLRLRAEKNSAGKLKLLQCRINKNPSIRALAKISMLNFQFLIFILLEGMLTREILRFNFSE